MNNSDWLTRFLFIHTRMTSPDGRPLYAYKCGNSDYAKLQELVQQLLALDSKGQWAPRIPQLFCLYAAETFCREHSEGAWKWETVFNPLGMKCPSLQNKVYVWVEKGLEWWQRPLIRGQKGNREYLDSIACEGGLPLRLLQKDNAALNRSARCFWSGMNTARIAKHRCSIWCNAASAARNICLRWSNMSRVKNGYGPGDMRETKTNSNKSWNRRKATKKRKTLPHKMFRQLDNLVC